MVRVFFFRLFLNFLPFRALKESALWRDFTVPPMLVHAKCMHTDKRSRSVYSEGRITNSVSHHKRLLHYHLPSLIPQGRTT